MSQVSAAFQGSFADAQEALALDTTRRIEEVEAKVLESDARALEQAERVEALYESIFGSAESLSQTAGGALEDLAKKVGEGLNVMARLGIPTGTMLLTNQTNREALAENGWLICDGTEFAVSDYPELAERLGTKWGVPAQSDMIKLPGGTLLPGGLTQADVNWIVRT